MGCNDDVLKWLLEGDPAIRWQVMRDLQGRSSRAITRERNRVGLEGWGAEFLRRQDERGTWSGAHYSPKWTSTTCTLLDLRFLGLPQGSKAAQKGCRVLLDEGFYRDGGINFWGRWCKNSETCVTSIVLSELAYFAIDDSRLNAIAEHLVNQQMPDGGWNCRRPFGATHGSFHTTILALEALLEYDRFRGGTEATRAAQLAGREFLLVHRLFRSHRTGKVARPDFLRLPYPPRWHYNILRGLDHFRDAGAERDARLADAIAELEKRRLPDGRWPLSYQYPGRVWMEMETRGQPSRWNTLRALRVLQWWYGSD
jgi:hypothetical protein